MALANTGLPTSFSDGSTPFTGPQAEMTTQAVDSQLFVWLKAAIANYPNGAVLPLPDSTSWATSSAGVVSPGAGIVPNVNVGATGAVLLRTGGDLTVTTSTIGWDDNATGLYLFVVAEYSTNDSRKTGVPYLVLSDSSTYNGGILIASGVATDSDSITAAVDARVFPAADILNQTTEATIASGDWILIYDVSVSAYRKITRANLVAGLISNPMSAPGDLIYGGASGTPTRLAPNTTTTRKFLRETGDGANGAAPAWDTIVEGDVPTLPQSKITDLETDLAAKQLTSNLSTDIVADTGSVTKYPSVAAVEAAISAFTGAVIYQGVWNASTNSPDLGASSPLKGYYYVVSVAGSTSLGSITDWAVGDWAIYNGSAWQKVDNSEQGTLTVQEADGSPSVSTVTQINFDGATVTNEGGGEVTVTIVGAVDEFTDLIDAPSSYTDSAGSMVAVKDTENGVEFRNIREEWIDGFDALVDDSDDIVSEATVDGGVRFKFAPGAVVDDGGFVGVSAYLSTTNQTIADDTETPVEFNAENYDSHGFHDNFTDNTKFTIPSGKAGYYCCHAQLDWNPDATGGRTVRLVVNGTDQWASLQEKANSGIATYSVVRRTIYLDAADFVEVMAEQNSGGPLDLTAGTAPGATHFEMYRVGV